VVVLAVVVEEFVWRGVLLDAAMQSPKAGPARVFALVGSTASYTVAQAGSASWALALVAFVLGLVWGLQRLWDGSLVSALLTHVIWSLSVLVFVPLEVVSR
jgi:membrane protease YdiL (CAAX protease family)